MFDRVRNWYHGTPKTLEFDNDPGSGVVFMPYFYTEYHWTARVARSLVSFYLRHWQWLWTTILAIAALIISVAALASARA